MIEASSIDTMSNNSYASVIINNDNSNLLSAQQAATTDSTQEASNLVLKQSSSSSSFIFKNESNQEMESFLELTRNGHLSTLQDIIEKHKDFLNTTLIDNEPANSLKFFNINYRGQFFFLINKMLKCSKSFIISRQRKKISWLVCFTHSLLL